MLPHFFIGNMDNEKYFNNAYSENQNKWLCADAWAENEVQKHRSAPFILQLVNSNDDLVAAISDVDIGDAATNRTATNFGQNSAITTTSTISGTTYREFLASVENSPILIGKTIVISTTAGQIEQPIAVTHRDVSGKRQDFVISPVLDPNQAQTGRVVDDTEFLLDSMTRFRINQVASGATVTFRFYPKVSFSATQIVAGRPEVQVFDSPNIVKSAMVKL